MVHLQTLITRRPYSLSDTCKTQIVDSRNSLQEARLVDPDETSSCSLLHYSAWPPRILIWHRNEKGSLDICLDIADLS